MNCEHKQHQCFACGKLGSSDKSSGAAEVCIYHNKLNFCLNVSIFIWVILMCWMKCHLIFLFLFIFSKETFFLKCLKRTKAWVRSTFSSERNDLSISPLSRVNEQRIFFLLSYFFYSLLVRRYPIFSLLPLI